MNDDLQGKARPSLRARRATRAARALGWFSLGLGLAEVLWPRHVSRAGGLDGPHALVRAYGLREMVNGAGLLAARDPEPWLWARVGGDVLDIATVSARRDDGHRIAGGAALAALAGLALLDLACAQLLRADKQRRARPRIDYRDRSGLPLPAAEMRGAAREDFEAPSDFRTPEALQPYTAR